MRIESNAPDPKELATSRASTSSAAAESAHQSQQTMTVPRERLSLHSLTARTLQVPEMRLEKVEQLKEMIASGRYQVKAKQIADAILYG